MKTVSMQTDRGWFLGGENSEKSSRSREECERSPGLVFSGRGGDGLIFLSLCCCEIVAVGAFQRRLNKSSDFCLHLGSVLEEGTDEAVMLHVCFVFEDAP